MQMVGNLARGGLDEGEIGSPSCRGVGTQMKTSSASLIDSAVAENVRFPLSSAERNSVVSTPATGSSPSASESTRAESTSMPVARNPVWAAAAARVRPT